MAFRIKACNETFLKEVFIPRRKCQVSPDIFGEFGKNFSAQLWTSSAQTGFLQVSRNFTKFRIDSHNCVKIVRLGRKLDSCNFYGFYKRKYVCECEISSVCAKLSPLHVCQFFD